MWPQTRHVAICGHNYVAMHVMWHPVGCYIYSHIDVATSIPTYVATFMWRCIYVAILYVGILYVAMHLCGDTLCGDTSMWHPVGCYIYSHIDVATSIPTYVGTSMWRCIYVVILYVGIHLCGIL